MWGATGAGGAGAWNTTTAEWWDGSQNVPWPSGGDAVFAGTSGTVTSFNFGPVVSSITFNTPGYAIQSGWLKSSTSGLTITTNVDAAISSTLSNSASAGNFLVKNGAGTLTASGTDFLGAILVNQGEYRVSGSEDLFSSSVTLADSPGVALTLGQNSASQGLKSLSGGGTQGGLVQPDAQARTVSLTLSGGGSFGGTFQDNGSGVLALSLAAGSNYIVSGTGSNQTILGNPTNLDTQFLTNANTYSGATSINVGILSLAGNGSILNSTVTVSSFGTLVLDNSTVANPARISSSTVFTLANSRLQLIGNTGAAVNQSLGTLSIRGTAAITVTQPGSAATQLTFAGFTRNAHATLSISGSGVLLPGPLNDSTGIVTPAITVANDWASVAGDGRITAYSGYATDLNAASSTSHVKLTSSGMITLAAAGTRASVNLQNSNAGVDQVLDLAGQSLALSSGGILSSGAGTSTIQNGTLSTGAAEWIVTANNNLTISAPIQEANTATDLTKTGTGTLTLSGTNTYGGTTSIDQGTLAVASDANLGNGATVEFGGGTLLAGANFSSAKGLTKTSPLAGYIDTNGHNVSFSGVNSGAINKIGSGTLTLSNGSTGTTYVTVGTLSLPNATAGASSLEGGILQAAGTLSSLTVQSASTLDIGGPAAATLVTTSFSDHAILTIDFGIGSSGSDQWSITQPFSAMTLGAGSLQFEFQDLGGLTKGVDYPLLTFPSSGGAPAPTLFALAPDLVAAGWAATFKTTTTSASVNFSSLPEPAPGVLAILASAGFVFNRRRTGNVR